MKVKFHNSLHVSRGTWLVSCNVYMQCWKEWIIFFFKHTINTWTLLTLFVVGDSIGSDLVFSSIHPWHCLLKQQQWHCWQDQDGVRMPSSEFFALPCKWRGDWIALAEAILAEWLIGLGLSFSMPMAICHALPCHFVGLLHKSTWWPSPKSYHFLLGLSLEAIICTGGWFGGSSIRIEVSGWELEEIDCASGWEGGMEAAGVRPHLLSRLKLKNPLFSNSPAALALPALLLIFCC